MTPTTAAQATLTTPPAEMATSPAAAKTRRVARERPKIDRIACPWLGLRFIDPAAEFLYVPAAQVLAVGASTGATPYDIPGVDRSHVGGHCSFDALYAWCSACQGATHHWPPKRA